MTVRTPAQIATSATDLPAYANGSSTYFAIVASTAENCYGTAVNPQGEAVGVSASTVLNCVGSANAAGDGVSADLAHNCYGYSEGGASGPEYCSTSTTVTSIVAPCSSLPEPTGLTESQDGLTASRHYRANNVTVGIHYEF